MGLEGLEGRFPFCSTDLWERRTTHTVREKTISECNQSSDPKTTKIKNKNIKECNAMSQVLEDAD